MTRYGEQVAAQADSARCGRERRLTRRVFAAAVNATMGLRRWIAASWGRSAVMPSVATRDVTVGSQVGSVVGSPAGSVVGSVVGRTGLGLRRGARRKRQRPYADRFAARLALRPLESRLAFDLGLPDATNSISLQAGDLVIADTQPGGTERQSRHFRGHHAGAPPLRFLSH